MTCRYNAAVAGWIVQRLSIVPRVEWPQMAADADAKAGKKSNIARNIKIASTVLVAVVVLVTVILNREPVELKIFFLPLTMPKAVLVFACLVIGYILGILWSFRRN
jgi:uncharacterized integral membrane protein